MRYFEIVPEHLESVCHRLPRELRDEIYYHMWKSRDEQSTDNSWILGIFALTSRLHEVLNAGPRPIQFVEEAAEFLFNNCQIFDVEASSTLPIVFGARPFGLILSPDFSKLVQLDVNIPNLSYEGFPLAATKPFRHVGSLFGLHYASTVTVNTNIEAKDAHYTCSEPTCLAMLPASFLTALIQYGYTVRVLINGSMIA
ncbi:hypothetical protein BDV96DRAFT_653180 [Lophiotrema nucula]|uniref:Uncharacterized protein n=1 Tax=Lophiotrema nucula TaxID=690887 RepID=A0A6A5YLG9_9PLEO|nr:hypothetical protein BDV96DRAFT_653180 [Lophiotrema nucula]